MTVAQIYNTLKTLDKAIAILKAKAIVEPNVYNESYQQAVNFKVKLLSYNIGDTSVADELSSLMVMVNLSYTSI